MKESRKETDKKAKKGEKRRVGRPVKTKLIQKICLKNEARTDLSSSSTIEPQIISIQS